MTHLYEHLGKVFYSIAAIDKTIRKEEINKLKQIIKTEWLLVENSFNEFGTTLLMKLRLFLTGLSPMNEIWNKCFPTLKFSEQNINTYSLRKLMP
ncbi:hypothetical protein [Flavobacterium sp. LS1P3]|jgi:hypothetical protein|uniref:hypothetical protein n=1 Tax=Flavobacterium sp. LS1P3 TaxID=3401720 RepID=UPI003AAF8290